MELPISFERAIHFQSLKELCGSSSLEIISKISLKANFKRLLMDAWSTVWENSGKPHQSSARSVVTDY